MQKHNNENFICTRDSQLGVVLKGDVVRRGTFPRLPQSRPVSKRIDGGDVSR